MFWKDYSLSNSRRHETTATANADVYLEKHCHVGKKLLTWVLYGTQTLYFNPVMFRLEHHSFPRS